MIKTFFAVSTVLLFMPFTSAFGQSDGYSDEKLQTRLDSLYQLEREARSNGEENKYAAEIKQLQTLIKTERERIQEEGLKEINENTAAKDINENPYFPTNIADFTAKISSFLAGNKLLDNLIILMGAIAILASIFLVFIRLFLKISSKNKKSTVKNKIPTKTANVHKDIDRYKKKTAAGAQNSETVIYSLKELASRNQPKITTIIDDGNMSKNDERPKKLSAAKPKNDDIPKNLTAAELKNEIIRRFDAGEDAAKIAHSFNVSQDQIAMILRLAGRK